ncbi:DNA glycosylase [Actinophytocola xinjiangensis]|uniref:DNA-(apurinic or apyrimidinic site) lyase n=1 Tax=Actinophytocola xinjiangensis TaxID=485602 RepID=A0A7Z0WRI2_9PSEU|nr:DNA-formamidopyrimidine glycosylase family protein [Actinophytocola xinjiangensis]OLF14011.1 DNA glycosylase [Actinophytocola xinjiangensis]
MPEGDTVRQTAVALTRELGGATLRRAQLRHPRLATADLTGRTVEGARSVGKHLFLRFGGDLSLHSHLGMDGSWTFHDPGRRAPVGHWTRVLLQTDTRLALGQRLLRLALVPTGEESGLVAHLGPDLLDPDWSPEMAELARRRLTADPDRELGLALLDQHVMAGVGNVYKTEVCFLLGVSPWTPVSGVDPVETVELCRKLLVDNADRRQRSTTGQPGRGRELWVYGRDRLGCLRCGGPVLTGVQGSGTRERIAYHCPRCQPGPA